MHGTQQVVGLGSVPTSARITVDNQPSAGAGCASPNGSTRHERIAVATTPTVMKVSRKDNHIVRIELDGYLLYETTLTEM